MKLAAVLGSLLVPFLAAAAVAQEKEFTRVDAARAIAGVREIVSENGVERLEKVTLGGLEQWISIRGRDRDNPILLYIHGGPGFPVMPLSWSFQQGWEDYFTVVQWDQRGAGKTYAEHDPKAVAPTMTREQIVSDAEALVALLREEFGQEKIFVLGLSWGSVVGLELAQRRPEWLHAYIGMGQVIDFRESEKRGFDFAMKEAKRRGDRTAQKALKEIAPYPPAKGEAFPPERLYAQRKWIEAFGGAMHNRKGYGAPAAAMQLSPDYTDADVAVMWDGTNFSFPLIFPELLEYDASSVTRIDCPVFLFLGRHDYNVVSSLGAEWLEALDAPVKDLVWFEHSAHIPMSEEPGKTLVELVNRVRPLAERP